MQIGTESLRGKLLVGGLVMIAAAAVATTVMGFLHRDPIAPDWPEVMHFKCLRAECGHEWEWTPQQTRQFDLDRNVPFSEATTRTYECPQCKWKHPDRLQWSGVRMAQCPYPECRKWYLPANVMADFYHQKLPSRPKCPHCGQDILAGMAKYGDK